VEVARWLERYEANSIQAERKFDDNLLWLRTRLERTATRFGRKWIIPGQVGRSLGHPVCEKAPEAGFVRKGSRSGLRTKRPPEAGFGAK